MALDAMAALGLNGVELRVVDGKNIIDLTDDEIQSVVAECWRAVCASWGSPRRC